MRDERRDLQQALDKYRLELAPLEARMPISAATMSELEAAVKVGQEKVDELAKNRTEAIRTFRLLVTKASTLIEDKNPAIKQHSKNCKSIPREDSELDYRERERTVGQSGEKIRFPGFDTMLTSGTFPDTPTPRLSIEDCPSRRKSLLTSRFASP